jgi:hypothetical protein
MERILGVRLQLQQRQRRLLRMKLLQLFNEELGLA